MDRLWASEKGLRRRKRTDLYSERRLVYEGDLGGRIIRSQTGEGRQGGGSMVESEGSRRGPDDVGGCGGWVSDEGDVTSHTTEIVTYLGQGEVRVSGSYRRDGCSSLGLWFCIGFTERPRPGTYVELRKVIRRRMGVRREVDVTGVVSRSLLFWCDCCHTSRRTLVLTTPRLGVLDYVSVGSSYPTVSSPSCGLYETSSCHYYPKTLRNLMSPFSFQYRQRISSLTRNLICLHSKRLSHFRIFPLPKPLFYGYDGWLLKVVKYV